MDKKVLMIEYVTDLRLVEFLVGTPTGNPEIGTVSKTNIMEWYVICDVFV